MEYFAIQFMPFQLYALYVGYKVLCSATTMYICYTCIHVRIQAYIYMLLSCTYTCMLLVSISRPFLIQGTEANMLLQCYCVRICKKHDYVGLLDISMHAMLTVYQA